MTTNSISCAAQILAALELIHPCGYFTAPGSRNAPFLQLLNQVKTQKVVHFDERALGFLALGAAKASMQYAVIITTSGTALGNLMPAIMEANNSHVPLLVISADRPFELLAHGANQTCNQDNIFNSYAEFLHLPPLSEAITADIYIQNIIIALKRANSLGIPLHINVELREPLYDEQITSTLIATYSQKITQYRNNFIFNTNYYPDKNLIKTLLQTPKSYILAGSLSPAEAKALYALGAYFNIPIIADVQSNIRGYPGVISSGLLSTQKNKHLAQILLDATNIIIFEGRFISNAILQILSTTHAQKFFCSKYLESLDATASGGVYLNFSLCNLVSNLVPIDDLNKFETNIDKLPLPLISQNIATYINTQQVLSINSEVKIPKGSELHYTTTLNNAAEKILFIGNSLVARYADLVLNTAKEIYTNRGVSGIDGLIATACGIAKIKGPTLAVIGDTSALYDISSIILLKNTPVRLIVFNNNGGGIFEKFPLIDQSVKEQFFINPTTTNFCEIGAAFGVKNKKVTSPLELQTLLQEPPSNTQGGIIECNFCPEQGIKALAHTLSH